MFLNKIEKFLCLPGINVFKNFIFFLGGVFIACFEINQAKTKIRPRVIRPYFYSLIKCLYGILQSTKSAISSAKIIISFDICRVDFDYLIECLYRFRIVPIFQSPLRGRCMHQHRPDYFLSRPDRTSTASWLRPTLSKVVPKIVVCFRVIRFNSYCFFTGLYRLVIATKFTVHNAEVIMCLSQVRFKANSLFKSFHRIRVAAKFSRKQRQDYCTGQQIQHNFNGLPSRHLPPPHSRPTLV